jgi:uncharacterized protein (DUF2267 family)
VTTVQVVTGVRRRLPGRSRVDARHVVGVVLRTLAERLPAGEAALLASALPPTLAQHMRDPARPGSTELVAGIAGDCGTNLTTAERYARAVLAAVAEFVPDGVLYRVQLPLPDDVRALFPTPVTAVGREAPAPTPVPSTSRAASSTSAAGTSVTNGSRWSQPSPGRCG